ncbi:MAG: hypothetical protein E7Z68_08905 [Thermoplasmata archaeon]|nr:hypothetical protein [Thermoplasmata archaeon]
MSVFDTMERSKLQEMVLSGEIDSDCLLKDLVQWVTLVYYNLFANLDTGEHRACPVSRKDNAAYALRQSFKKSMLAKLIKKSTISKETPS